MKIDRKKSGFIKINYEIPKKKGFNAVTKIGIKGSRISNSKFVNIDFSYIVKGSDVVLLDTIFRVIFVLEQDEDFDLDTIQKDRVSLEKAFNLYSENFNMFRETLILKNLPFPETIDELF